MQIDAAVESVVLIVDVHHRLLRRAVLGPHQGGNLLAFLKIPPSEKALPAAGADRRGREALPNSKLTGTAPEAELGQTTQA
jgi:hypothetical protein